MGEPLDCGSVARDLYDVRRQPSPEPEQQIRRLAGHHGVRTISGERLDPDLLGFQYDEPGPVGGAQPDPPASSASSRMRPRYRSVSTPTTLAGRYDDYPHPGDHGLSASPDPAFPGESDHSSS